MIGTELSIFDPFSGLTDALTDLVTLTIAVVILLIVGLLLLANKLVVVPKPWSLIVGGLLIVAALYLVYKGGF